MEALRLMEQPCPTEVEIRISSAGAPLMIPSHVHGTVVTLMAGLMLIAVEEKSQKGWQMILLGPATSV